MIDVSGRVDDGWQGVAEAFAANFEQHGDVGAACCVYRDGRAVVDIWAGVADRESGRAWVDDTIVLVFSSTKGVTAIAAHLLAERGELDLDAPVADYWPEFGVAGKDRIPVRWLLTHQAGLPAVEGTFSLDDVVAWHPIADALAAQAPEWEPGTAHGYHMRSYGWLVGEVIRRVSGRTPGEFIAAELAAPLGLDLFVGLPEREEARLATIIPPPPLEGEAQALYDMFTQGDSLTGRVFRGPSDLFQYDERWNRRELHQAEMPSSNGISDARSLARLYAAVIGEVDGVRLLRPETVAAAAKVQAEGSDAVLVLPTRFATGFALPPMLGLACPPSAFGHPGAGGSLGFADPEAGIAFGYAMNQMNMGLSGDPRTRGLVEAVYAAL